MARLNLNDNDLTHILVALRATGQHALAERVVAEAHDADDDAEDDGEYENAVVISLLLSVVR